MSSYVIEVNERKTSGKYLIPFLKSLDSIVHIMPHKEESPYNPEFVAKIQRSMKSEGKAIKIEDLWK